MSRIYRRDIGRHIDESVSKATRIERIAAILVESGILYFLFHVSITDDHSLCIGDADGQLQLQAVISDSGNIPALEHSTPGLTFAGTIWTYNMSHIMVISLVFP